MEDKAPKSTIEFMPQLDGLRFIAVFSVMIFHWFMPDFDNSLILSNIPFGTGVNLFFVISGFLITYILLNKKEQILENKVSFSEVIRNFYVKRILRIFPIYYILIGLLCIFSYDTIKNYLVYLLTYTTNWYMLFKGDYLGSQGHLWSLAIEEQFYLIWPCIILLSPKKWTLRIVISSIVISLASKIYFLYYTPYWMGVNAATFSCFDSLGLGALIAYIQWKKTASFKPVVYKLGLFISVILYIFLFDYPGCLSPGLRALLSNFATSVIFFFIVMLAANRSFGGGFKSFLENKTVLYLGRISYGLYLYHVYMPKIFYNGLNRLLPNLKSDADQFILFFAMTVIAASISWYLVERPILNLKKYFQK